MNLSQACQLVDNIDESSSLTQKSILWKSFFKNRPDLNDSTFNDFLSPNSNGGNGIGLGKMTLDAYIDRHKKWIERYNHNISIVDIEAYPEPSIGNPLILEHHGYSCSVPYIKNFALAKLLIDKVEELNLDQPLKILEVGAGYGGMAQVLIKKGLCSHYSIVDLPEMLPWSLSYLSSVFPNKKIGIGETSELAFYTPNLLDSITERFDLIINISSFGEMPKQVAIDYVRMLPDLLTQQGILFSHNSQSRTVDGVKRHSEYGFQKYNILSIESQPNVAGFFHDQHLLLCLQKSFRSNIDGEHLNFLSMLVAIGLHEEVNRLGSNAVIKDFSFINDANEICRTYKNSLLPRNKKKQKKRLQAMIEGGEQIEVCNYLLAVFNFIESDRSAIIYAKEYLGVGGSKVARAFCKSISSIDNKENYLDDEASSVSLRSMRKRYKNSLGLLS